MNYKILRVININYETIFDDFKKKNINKNNYFNLKKSFFDQSYMYCNSFSEKMVEIGNDALDIIYNFEELQNLWSLENSQNKEINLEENLSEKLFLIFLDQIKFYKPEILYFKHCAPFSSNRLKYIKENNSFIKKIIFHNGFTLTNEEIKNVDIIFAALPFLKSYYLKKGVKSKLIYHYFDENILNKINRKIKKKDKAIFVGKTGSQKDKNHFSRFNFIKNLIHENSFYFFSLEKDRDNRSKKNLKQVLRNILIKNTKIIPNKVINNLINRFENNKLIRLLKDSKKPTPEKYFLHELYPDKIYNAVYGIEMFQLLSDNNFVLNIHSDESVNHCGNIRMFEATGVGSCLLTDHKQNLQDLFIPDEEVISYTSKSELISKLNYLQNNLNTVQEISKKGQERTLKNHTTKSRVEEIDIIIKDALKN